MPATFQLLHILVIRKRSFTADRRASPRHSGDANRMPVHTCACVHTFECALTHARADCMNRIYSKTGGTGGRAGGRADGPDGRVGGRTDGRTDGRTGGTGRVGRWTGGRAGGWTAAGRPAGRTDRRTDGRTDIRISTARKHARTRRDAAMRAPGGSLRSCGHELPSDQSWRATADRTRTHARTHTCTCTSTLRTAKARDHAHVRTHECMRAHMYAQQTHILHARHMPRDMTRCAGAT